MLKAVGLFFHATNSITVVGRSLCREQALYVRKLLIIVNALCKVDVIDLAGTVSIRRCKSEDGLTQTYAGMIASEVLVDAAGRHVPCYELLTDAIDRYRLTVSRSHL